MKRCYHGISSYFNELNSKTIPQDISSYFTISSEYEEYVVMDYAIRIGDILYIRIIFNKGMPVLDKNMVFNFDGRLQKFINCYGISGAYNSENDYDTIKSALLSYSGYQCVVSTSSQVEESLSITFISVFI